LQESPAVATRTGALKPAELARVIVDITAPIDFAWLLSSKFSLIVTDMQIKILTRCLPNGYSDLSWAWIFQPIIMEFSVHATHESVRPALRIGLW
jgi:hypothetical protein